MDEAIWGRRHELLFNARRSRRYHLWRVRLLHRWNTFRMVLFLVTTSVVATTLIGEVAPEMQDLWKKLSLVPALLAALEIVLRSGDRESEHRSFARSFASLEGSVMREGFGILEERLAELEAEYLEIEVNEPPISPLLNRICYNEEVRASYSEEEWPGLLKPIPLEGWLLSVWYQMPRVKARISS